MTDEQVLFAVICFLYITDCFVWLDRHSVAFVSSSWNKWRLVFPSVLFGNADAGLVLLNPLPSSGLSYVCRLLPVSISPLGICAYNSQTLRSGGKSSQTGITIPFTDIRNVCSEGKSIIVNESRFVKCGTEFQASVLADFLKSVSSAPEENRDSLIRGFFQRTLDDDSAKSFLETVSGQTRILRLLCNITFFFIFLAMPLLVIYYGLRTMIIPVGICSFLLSIRISVEFYISHKKLYPQASEDRIVNLLKVILCPPVAIRAPDIIANSSLDSFHPLNIAHILLDKNKYRTFARELMADLKYPMHHDLTDNNGMLITKWNNDTLFDLCGRYLKDVAKLKIDLFAPPAQTDEHCRSYCPRCLGQLNRVSGECPDCPGVKLVLFSPNKQESSEGSGVRDE